jgi:hypothetical protein
LPPRKALELEYMMRAWLIAAETRKRVAGEEDDYELPPGQSPDVGNMSLATLADREEQF